MTDYSGDKIRKAYMTAYYPYFIAPASYVASNYVAPNMNASVGNRAFFAADPCHELLGVADVLVTPPNQIMTLDAEASRFPYQKLT